MGAPARLTKLSLGHRLRHLHGQYEVDATVLRTTFLRRVVTERLVLRIPHCSEPVGLHIGKRRERCYYAGGSRCGEVPIGAETPSGDRLVIGVALDSDQDRPILQLLADRLEHQPRVVADLVITAGEQDGLVEPQHQFIAGLLLLLLSRLCDGLDGTLARLTVPTDRGAFLDITLDFLFYASSPRAFAVADPAATALAAAVLLTAFIGTATTFLAFAVLAGQRGLKSVAYPTKGIYYLGGLTEATETLLCFALMCLWPAYFAVFAGVFTVMCMLTIVMRLWVGCSALSE